LAAEADGLSLLDPKLRGGDLSVALVAPEALQMPLGAQRDNGSFIDWLRTAGTAGRKQFPEM